MTSKLCKYCEQEPVAPRHPHVAKMSLCFSCYFWLGIAFKVLPDDKNSVRVEGHHYYINPEDIGTDVKWCRGHGGRKYIIKFNDGREVISTNLWHQGEIPPHFAEILPDNATLHHDVDPDPLGLETLQ